jgi:hypothetical protein
VKRAAGDVRDVDARRRSARMCLEASLADVPSSERGGESGCLARTSVVAGMQCSGAREPSTQAADGRSDGRSGGLLCGGDGGYGTMT